MVQMSRLTPILAATTLAAGCAGGAASLEEQPLFAAGWSGPPPHVAVQLAGSDAGGDKQQRCSAALVRAGAVVDGNAPVQAIVTVERTGNRLRVTTRRRGVVRDDPRPAWSIERLCDDALLALVAAIREEQPGQAALAPRAPPAYSNPPFSSEPGARSDGPPALPSSSGGTYRGPISSPTEP